MKRTVISLFFSQQSSVLYFPWLQVKISWFVPQTIPIPRLSRSVGNPIKSSQIYEVVRISQRWQDINYSSEIYANVIKEKSGIFSLNWHVGDA